jgi:hypothetical protein
MRFAAQRAVNSTIIAIALAFVATLIYVSKSRGGEPPNDPEAIEGLWSGAWGGGGVNGVIYQPVTAELFIKGNHVELQGFPKVDDVTGTVRFDARNRQVQITPAAAAAGQRANVIVYTCEIKADELVLTDKDKFSISLHRHRVARNPPANAQVDLVAATGINDEGDLLVTEFRVLRAGRDGATYFQPVDRSLKTKQATVLLVHNSGCKEVTIDEARRLIRQPTPVAVAYRHDDLPSQHQLHQLWKESGPPVPDSEAVFRTYSRILRPGTLVFVLSASENVPVP